MHQDEYKKKNRKYGAYFFLLYFIIVASWLSVIIYRFVGHDPNNSFILSSYLVDGSEVLYQDVTRRPILTVVNYIIEANMLILSGFLGTLFLIYFILPKLKVLSYWLIIAAFLVAESPFIFSLTSTISDIKSNHYLTVNDFLLLMIMLPLNYAVTFYLYYLIESYIIAPKKIKSR